MTLQSDALTFEGLVAAIGRAYSVMALHPSAQLEEKVRSVTALSGAGTGRGAK